MNEGGGSFPVIISFIIAAGAFSIIVLSLLQLASAGKRGRLHYIQNSFFIICGFCLLCDPYTRLGTEYVAPWLLYVNYPLAYVLPVLFYFYFLFLFDLKKKFLIGDLLLLSPALAVFIVLIPFFLLPPGEKLALFPLDNLPRGYPGSYSRLIEYGMFPWITFCVALTLFTTRHYLFGGMEHVKAILIYLVLSCLLGLASALSDYTDNLSLYKFAMVCLVFLMFGLLVMSVRNPDFYLKVRKQSHQIRYARSRIGELDMGEVLRRIDELMGEEELYRDPGLTLPELGRRLDLSQQQLSEIINSRFQMNFNAFLNSYRMEAVKRELREKGGRSILAIALDCGFNSKSAFNQVFLNSTGMTPSRWRKEASPDSPRSANK